MTQIAQAAVLSEVPCGRWRGRHREHSSLNLNIRMSRAMPFSNQSTLTHAFSLDAIPNNASKCRPFDTLRVKAALFACSRFDSSLESVSKLTDMRASPSAS